MPYYHLVKHLVSTIERGFDANKFGGKTLSSGQFNKWSWFRILLRLKKKSPNWIVESMTKSDEMGIQWLMQNQKKLRKRYLELCVLSIAKTAPRKLIRDIETPFALTTSRHRRCQVCTYQTLAVQAEGIILHIFVTDKNVLRVSDKIGRHNPYVLVWWTTLVLRLDLEKIK